MDYAIDQSFYLRAKDILDRLDQNERLQRLASVNGIDVKNSTKLTGATKDNIATSIIALILAKHNNDSRYSDLVRYGMDHRRTKIEIINDYKDQANQIIARVKNNDINTLAGFVEQSLIDSESCGDFFIEETSLYNRVTGYNYESIIHRILMFIPRLLMNLIDAIIKFNKTHFLRKAITKFKSMENIRFEVKNDFDEYKKAIDHDYETLMTIFQSIGYKRDPVEIYDTIKKLSNNKELKNLYFASAYAGFYSSNKFMLHDTSSNSPRIKTGNTFTTDTHIMTGKELADFFSYVKEKLDKSHKILDDINNIIKHVTYKNPETANKIHDDQSKMYSDINDVYSDKTKRLEEGMKITSRSEYDICVSFIMDISKEFSALVNEMRDVAYYYSTYDDYSKDVNYYIKKVD